MVSIFDDFSETRHILSSLCFRAPAYIIARKEHISQLLNSRQHVGAVANAVAGAHSRHVPAMYKRSRGAAALDMTDSFND
jgi:hypothetical protein